MRGIVPNNVLDQPNKYGFAAPLSSYMQADAHRFDECYREVVGACPYFDNSAAVKLLKNYRSGRVSSAPHRHVWRVFSVALWHDRFMRRT
jgi:hypothetical protein